MQDHSDSPPPEGQLIEAVFDKRAKALTEELDHETRRWLDWQHLAQSDPPEYEWLIPHWLGWHPTLLSGRGSVGKSLLAQQIGTALALGTEFLGPARAPLKVLMWMCEDDHDELWRRQERICKQFGTTIGQLTGFTIDARLGMRNDLYGMEYGKGGWTKVFGELQAQIEETQADVLVLDNIGHCYAGGENTRHDVTTFCAGIAGLCKTRKFASILLGHIAKAEGSEYAGSTAWENAVRMRWYMGDKLPDQQQNDDDEPDGTVRYLCKRKANYTALDYVQLDYDNGTFKVNRPNGADASPLMHAMRHKRAETVLSAAMVKLAQAGIHGAHQVGTAFLPALVMQHRLHESCTRTDLTTAMRAMMLDGRISREEIGKYANRSPRYGLILAAQTRTNLGA